MSGAGLIAIKRRIKSVTNTRKITKAMGLVATSKLRKGREKLTANLEYHKISSRIIKDMVSNAEDKSVFRHQGKSDKKLYIVFTSDTGLCGSFNINVISGVIDEIKKDKKPFEIMVIGQKGRNSLRKLKYSTVAEYVDIEDIPTLREAGIISNHAIELYESDIISEVHVVYTKFISPVNMVVKCEKVLPISVEGYEDSMQAIQIEPSVDEIVDEVIRTYLRGEVYHCMVNAKTSEFAHRMTAMDGSTKNATDLIDKLNLQYNRIRQSSITQEISEIVGGSEAQK